MFDPYSARAHFPALSASDAPIYFDGPGGTQVPERVIQAMANYLRAGNANLFDLPVPAVQRTHDVVREAREKAAVFIHAPRADDIIFGPNMTTITAHLWTSGTGKRS